MKKLILTAICGCMALFARAQAPTITSTVKGLVIDSAKNMPLAYFNVALTDPETQQSVKAMQTKEDGSFELTGIPYHTYQLKISGIGYKEKLLTVVAVQAVIDLGKINLTEVWGQLKEVAITASRPTVIQEVDRMVYDVQADPDNKTFDALDIMRKVPLLSVDANDNIQLKGSGSYKILINGKESAIISRDPADILRSMPASNIERIEVITTPPAKYDAEGLAGIINIITKTKGPKGYNGSLNGRYNTVNGPALNLNTTIQEEKLGVGIYAGGVENGHYGTAFGNSQTFLSNGSSLVQNGVNQNGDENYKTILNLSYEIDSLNLITASFDYLKTQPFIGSTELSSELSNTGALTQQYNLNNTGSLIYTGWDAFANYQLGFKKSKEQLLTFSYQYSTSTGVQSTNNIFYDEINFTQPNYQQALNSGFRNHIFQLDYAQPFSKLFQLEAGAKVITRDFFSNFNSDLQNAVTGQYVLDPTQTDNFNYQQDVYSLYNSYQVKSGAWAVKAGWRIERTTVDASFVNTAITPLNTNYNNLIPSIAIQRKFEQGSITFGFTDRLQRPDINQVNPYVNLSNPKFISMGNPGIKPELSHTFELNYSNTAKNSFVTGFSYAFSNNSIQSISATSIQTINNHLDTVTTSTYQNLGSNRRLAYNFNTNLSLLKGLSMNANVQLARTWLIGTYNGQLYSNAGNTAVGFGGISYQSAAGYRLSSIFSYASGKIFLEGTSSHALNSQFSLSKEFMAKKLNVALAVVNPYSKYITNYTYTHTADYMQTSYNQPHYTSFTVRFNYKFGRLSTAVKKSKNGINNEEPTQNP